MGNIGLKVFVFSIFLFIGFFEPCSANLSIQGLGDSYVLSDKISCRLVNDTDQQLTYFYTGETTFSDGWGEIDYSLESGSKSVPIHVLEPHSTAILEWPAWRKRRLAMSENKKYRFLVYYHFRKQATKTKGIDQKLRSREFGVKYADSKDYPPAFFGLQKSYKPRQKMRIGLVNTWKEEIEYQISADKFVNGQWVKVLYNLKEPFNDQKTTFVFSLNGNEKKSFPWPSEVLQKEGVPSFGKYRLVVEYALTHGEDRKIYSPEFEISK